MKSRYQPTKSDVEKLIYRYYDEVAEGIAQQAVAICLYALHLQGWRTKRINWAYERFLEVFNMPPVFGEKAKCEDCMAFLTKAYGIDFDRISLKKETFAEFRRR